MKIYESLKKIYESEAKKDGRFLRSYKDDFYKIDKEFIKEDACPGDRYIGVLKSNGCGTFLNRLNCKGEFNSAQERILEGGDDSKFYHITFSGINEGTIEEVTYDQALDMSRTVPENPYRKPRRFTLREQLAEMLGIKSMGGTQFDRGFKIKDGDVTAIKIHVDSLNRGVIEVARVKMSGDYDDYDLQNTKKIDEFFVPVGFDKAIELKEPIYLSAKVKYEPFAELTSISKRAFTNAVNKAKQKTMDSELSY